MAATLAAIALCATVIAMIALAAPQAASGCPGGRTAVTGRSRVVIGRQIASIPLYGCETQNPRSKHR